ncbi:RNA polymerase sigma factor sigE [Forsythia ovata]|uniref:RNA polymerase sigma factor sigE n=1 Tax=Forsythia ovata TaxID=205694 RepID=A0ABD1X2I2_9LAMI
MGVVTVSTSAARTPLGLSTKFSTRLSSVKRPVILSFKTDKTKNTALVGPRESVSLPVETAKDNEKRLRVVKKRSERVHAVLTDEAISSTSTLDLDYNEAASKLEHIYKRSPSDKEIKDQMVKRRRRRRKRGEAEEEGGKGCCRYCG